LRPESTTELRAYHVALIRHPAMARFVWSLDKHSLPLFGVFSFHFDEEFEQRSSNDWSHSMTADRVLIIPFCTLESAFPGRVSVRPRFGWFSQLSETWYPSRPFRNRMIKIGWIFHWSQCLLTSLSKSKPSIWLCCVIVHPKNNHKSEYSNVEGFRGDLQCSDFHGIPSETSVATLSYPLLLTFRGGTPHFLWDLNGEYPIIVWHCLKMTTRERVPPSTSPVITAWTWRFGCRSREKRRLFKLFTVWLCDSSDQGSDSGREPDQYLW
jgi:hypothetical protein